MEIDTSKLSDEQVSKVHEFINYMVKKNEGVKWWIMPKYPAFGSEVQMYGQSYYVEPQQDIYAKSKPPLKSNFNSREEAQKWLDDYLAEEDKFLKAIDEINNLNCNLGDILAFFSRHEYVTKDYWDKCFESFNVSMNHGVLKEVTKE